MKSILSKTLSTVAQQLSKFEFIEGEVSTESGTAYYLFQVGPVMVDIQIDHSEPMPVKVEIGQ